MRIMFIKSFFLLLQRYAVLLPSRGSFSFDISGVPSATEDPDAAEVRCIPAARGIAEDPGVAEDYGVAEYSGVAEDHGSTEDSDISEACCIPAARCAARDPAGAVEASYSA